MTEERLFKHRLGPAQVAALAARVAAHTPGFAADAFVRDAVAGLESLELKARVAHVAAALRRHLDPDPPAAIARLVASLGPAADGTSEVSSGFVDWPVLHFVEVYGGDHPEAALPALREMTRRFSAEFAIRPFVERDPERVLAVLAEWARDPDPHVRRLVSEGTRSRLPWGRRLTALVADPRPALPLLEALHRDEEEYVRRSVANHLNDISKDHPALAVEVARRWWASGDAATQRLVRRGLRTLIKAGHADALAVLGHGPPAGVEARLTVVPAAIRVGEAVDLSLELCSRAGTAQALVIDFALQRRLKDGRLAPKVFKWTTRTLGAGQTLALRKSLPLATVTTRRYYPGEHRVEVLVNGATLASATFLLEA